MSSGANLAKGRLHVGNGAFDRIVQGDRLPLALIRHRSFFRVGILAS
jgi:hypothetical protein